MSFLWVKKRVKFHVELTVVSLTDVPLLNAVIFAKVRLMECGTFEAFTCHRPVHAYRVEFLDGSSVSNAEDGGGAELTDSSLRDLADGCQPSTSAGGDPSAAVGENPQPFQFQCRIPFDERTGELEECRCKISLRKEDRAGRAPQKLGFVVLNLSEFAASGTTGVNQSYLLDGYTAGGQRPDNSRVNVHVRMRHLAQDPLFKVPKPALNNSATVEDEAKLNPADRKAPSSHFSASSILSAVDNQSLSADVDGGMLVGGSSSAEPIGDGPALISSSSTTTTTLRTPRAVYHLHPRPFVSAKISASLKAPINPSAIAVEQQQRASWHAGASYGNGGAVTTSDGNGTSTGTDTSTTVEALVPGVVLSASSSAGDTERLSMPIICSGGAAFPPALMNGGSLTTRVQRTRRDASGVIDEVLAAAAAAEGDDVGSALMAAAVAPSTAAKKSLCWEGGIGGGNDGVGGSSHDEEDCEGELDGNDRPLSSYYRHQYYGGNDVEFSSDGNKYEGGFVSACDDRRSAVMMTGVSNLILSECCDDRKKAHSNGGGALSRERVGNL